MATTTVDPQRTERIGNNTVSEAPRLTLEVLRASTVHSPFLRTGTTAYESTKSRLFGNAVPIAVGAGFFLLLSAGAYAFGQIASADTIALVGTVVYGPLLIGFGVISHFELRRAKHTDKLNNR